MSEGGKLDEQGPNPRTVPGFETAAALGLTPRVPDQPPAPVVMNSSHLLLGAVATSFAGIALLLVTVSKLNLPGWQIGAVATGVVGVVLALLVWHRQLMWAEIMAGYCRMDYMVALFSRDREGRFPASRMKGAPWDLSGLWLLGNNDEVVRQPVPGVLPPGRYPSPNRPGELELWTGLAWAYRYQKPDRPFS